MSYQINFNLYSSNFSLPERVLDDIVEIDGDYLKVALLIFKNAEKHYSANLISNLLGLPEKKVQQALAYWMQKGVFIQESSVKGAPQIHVLPEKKAPVPIASRASHNSELNFLLEVMEMQLHRPITSTEQKSVLQILEFIRLPADVILMAVQYCVSINKFNPRYLESVCASWADHGITTHERAENYLNLQKQNHQHEEEVKKLFGVQNRNLIEAEKEYIVRWFCEYEFDLELIQLAYERSITAINKLSFPYIGKILTNWHEKGYKTVDDIRKNEGGARVSYSSSNNSYDIEELDRYWDKVPKLK